MKVLNHLRSFFFYVFTPAIFSGFWLCHACHAHRMSGILCFGRDRIGVIRSHDVSQFYFDSENCVCTSETPSNIRQPPWFWIGVTATISIVYGVVFCLLFPRRSSGGNPRGANGWNLHERLFVARARRDNVLILGNRKPVLIALWL